VKNENAAAAARARWQQRKDFPQVPKPPATPKAVVAESSSAANILASWTNRAAQAVMVRDDSAALPGAQDMRARPPQRDFTQSRDGPSMRGGPPQVRPSPLRPVAPPARSEVLTPSSALPDKPPFIPPISGQQRSGSSINIKPLAQVRERAD
jgi:hypothetical protein